ncbi:MAG: zinc-ribbon domain-containing protein [Clostridia bacterium]|nr:zinc-ribbon domain-containing protein [Clostridia bacterium]
MFCIECGKHNPDGAKFCAFCGAKLYTGESVNEKASTPSAETLPAASVSQSVLPIQSQPEMTVPHSALSEQEQTEAIPNPSEETIRENPAAAEAETHTESILGGFSETAELPESTQSIPLKAADPVQSVHTVIRPKRQGTILAPVKENPAQPGHSHRSAVQASADAKPVPEPSKPAATPSPESPQSKSSVTMFFEDEDTARNESADDEDFGSGSKGVLPPFLDRVRSLFSRKDDPEEDPFAELDDEEEEVDELESAFDDYVPRPRKKSRDSNLDDEDLFGPSDSDLDFVIPDYGDNKVRRPRSMLTGLLRSEEDEVLTSSGTAKTPPRGKNRIHQKRDTHVPERIQPVRNRRRDDSYDDDDGYYDDEPGKLRSRLHGFTAAAAVVLIMFVCIWLFATKSGGMFLAGFNMSSKAEDYYNLGESARSGSQIKRAAEAYYKALSLDSNNYEYSLKVGITQQQIGEYETAIKAYYKCTTLKPNEPEPYMYLMKLYTAMGDNERAEYWRRQGQDNTVSTMFDK